MRLQKSSTESYQTGRFSPLLPPTSSNNLGNMDKAIMTKKYHSSAWVKNIADPYQRVVARFMDKVIRNELKECWEWGAAVDKNGYGSFQYSGINGELKSQKIGAHRISFELFIGDIPNGMIVCHKCDNPACVNPNHLFLGTTQINVDDRVSKQRSSRGAQHGRKTKPNAFKNSMANYRRTVDFMGQKMTPHEIAEETGIPVKIIIGRLDRGWSAEKAVATPPVYRGQDISWWENRKRNQVDPLDNEFDGTGVSVVMLKADRK